MCTVPLPILKLVVKKKIKDSNIVLARNTETKLAWITPCTENWERRAEFLKTKVCKVRKEADWEEIKRVKQFKQKAEKQNQALVENGLDCCLLRTRCMMYKKSMLKQKRTCRSVMFTYATRKTRLSNLKWKYIMTRTKKSGLGFVF